MANKTQRCKQYSSIDEIKKEFLPNLYANQNRLRKSPSEFGTDLAERTLEKIRQIKRKK